MHVLSDWLYEHLFEPAMTAIADIRHTLRSRLHAEEADLVRQLIAGTRLDEAARRAISGSAATLVEAVRSGTRLGLMESFLAEYGLDSEEGLALMSLAEALLRVPDSETVDALIHDKVGGADASYHMGCMAADIFIPGVSKSALIKAAYRENLVGGLGCYPGRHFIHIDVRARPRGWKKPVTWGC